MPKTPSDRTASITDAATRVWLVNDHLTRLREFGSENVLWDLPLAPDAEVFLGSDLDEIHDQDKDRKVNIPLAHKGVSRHHATMRRYGGAWIISDKESRNGVFVNNAPMQTTQILPGDLIACGKALLMAESPRIFALENLWRRYLGWGKDAATRAAIDNALWATHELATLRAPLIVSGAVGAGFARKVHDLARGREWPFATPASIPSAKPAIQALLREVEHGTLFVRASALPRRARRGFLEAQRETFKVRLIVASDPKDKARLGPAELAAAIVIPDLATRSKDEIRAAVSASVDAYRSQLGGAALREEDWKKLHAWRWVGHDEIDEVTHKFVALRRYPGHGGIAAAAREVGLTPSAISQWIQTHGIEH